MSEACPLCKIIAGEVLWRDDFCRVVRVDDDRHPGYCRVILHEHVREMTDLATDERQHLMAVVFAVEAVVRSLVRPDKINLSCLGNVVPHLHWHVIPRWHDDAYFPDTIWAAPRRETSARPVTPDLWPRLAQSLRERLAAG